VDGSGGHWTSTTSLRNRSSAWIIDMNYGDVLPYPKSQTLHVWPVRGGYPMLTTVVTDTTGGPGSGTVKRSVSGADYTTYCDYDPEAKSSPCIGTDQWPEGGQRYTQGKKVTLTAKPDKVSVFEGWSGYDACEGKKGSCTVTLSHDITAMSDASDDITVTAVFASYPTMSGSPSSKNYGKVKVWKTASAGFTIKNNTTHGKQDLIISDISLTGDTHFTILADKSNKCAPVPYVLNPGKSCSFKVTFTPEAAAGAQTATLTVSSSDPVAQEVSITLIGQGKP
jgi:hypothetical protein